MSFLSSIKDSLNKASTLLSSDNTKPDLKYITKRILTFTVSLDTITDQTTVQLQALATQLNKLHNDKYLIVNLSEKQYDYTLFNNNVVDYKFPGYPATPLHNILHINTAIHNWLAANNDNVCVVHCATGTGRTILTVANYLVWSNICDTMYNAVTLICNRLNINSTAAIIPTQHRYVEYMNQIYVHKTIPDTKPIVIERIIMYTVPAFEQSTDTTVQQSAQCRPYLQCFKDAKLIFTSTGLDNKLHWYNSSTDNSVVFSAGFLCYGDILIRVRHITHTTKRISMLRFGVHTGLLPAGHITLKKSELDGACTDSRFSDEFFIELIYRQAEQSDIDTALNTDATPTIPDTATAIQQNTTTEYWEQLASRSTMQPLSTHELITVPTATSIFTRRTSEVAVPTAVPAVVAPTPAVQPTVAQPVVPTATATNNTTSAVTSSAAAAATSASDTLKQATESMRSKFSSLFSSSKTTDTTKSTDVAIPVATVADNKSVSTDRQFSVGSDAATTRPQSTSFDELQAYVSNLNTQQSVEQRLDNDQQTLHVKGRESLPPPDFGDHPALNLLGESTNNTPTKTDLSADVPPVERSASEQLMHEMNQLTANSPVKHSAELEAVLDAHINEHTSDVDELDDEAAADMLAQLQAELSDS